MRTFLTCCIEGQTMNMTATRDRAKVIEYSLSLNKMQSWIRSKYLELRKKLEQHSMQIPELRKKLEPYIIQISGLSSLQKKTAVILSVVVVFTIVLLAGNTRREMEQTSTEERHKRDQDQISQDSSKGAVFTRWGRTVCPLQTRLVYEGVTGGSDHQNKGGGTNYVCLPLDPIYVSRNSHANYAPMHGAEYQDLDPLFNRELHQHNPPCAVCQSTVRTNMLMIPARKLCYPGWHAEYSGYLVAQHHGHIGKTEFVCLDDEPEKDAAGYRNENGALMYRAQGVCGSLPCPPYEEGLPLPCVVCTN